MSSKSQQGPEWPDLRLWFQNRPKFPPEEEAKYAGQHVAFSLDGLRILAGGASIDEVEQQLVAAGIDPSRVVHSYIPPPDLIML
jgi:hypothetical protein